MTHIGIMPCRKLTWVWRDGKLCPRVMSDQEAFEDDRECEGTIAALDNWRERQRPVWLLMIGVRNRG